MRRIANLSLFYLQIDDSICVLFLCNLVRKLIVNATPLMLVDRKTIRSLYP